MLRFLRAMLLTGLLFVGEAAAQSFTISGTVVEHGTNRPLKDAMVAISLVQEGQNLESQNPTSYRTGEDGRFVFTRLVAGKYSLSAQKRGFPRQMFEEYQEFSTAIAVGPGLNSDNIVFPLSAGGLITGTVTDEENEPIRQAQVILFSKGISSGIARVVLQQQRQTDSSGQFRFPHLKPGSYFVVVQARPWYAQNFPAQPQSSGNGQSNSDGELDVAYPLTYYDGAVDPASAAGITLAEGGVNNLQIVLKAVPALHIEVTGAQMKQGAGFFFNFMPVTFGGYQSFAQAQVSFSDDRVQVSGIAPGRYVVSPMASGEGHSENLGAAVFDFTGDDTIDVSAFRRPPLTGHILFEGAAPLPPHPMLFLYSANTGSASAISVEADGTLKQPEGSFLLAGRYEIWLRNAPGFFLRSVQANGALMPKAEIDIPSTGPIQLSLIAAKGLTSINGVVVRGDKPVARAMVLLIPKNFARSDFIGRDQSDSDGTFTLPDVPPGHYTLLAIDDGRDLAYQDPSVMKPYLSQGRELSVPLANASPVKTDVLPRQTASGQAPN